MLGYLFGSLLGTKLVNVFFGLIGWILIVYNLLRIKNFYWPFRKSQSFLFAGYLIIVLIMIVRGYTTDYPPWNQKNFLSFLNFHLLAPLYILPYFLPLLMFVGIRKMEFRSLLKINYFLNILFLILFVLNIKQILTGSQLKAEMMEGYDFESGKTTTIASFFFMTGFFLLCKKYISHKQWLLNLICWFLATMTVAIGARRGTTLILLLLGMSAAFLYIRSLRGKRKTVGSFLVVLFSLLLIGFYGLTEDKLFAYINERGMSDTRSHVDEALLEQMNTQQLWFGKGLNGRYYMGGFSETNYYSGWRYGSETGFFTLVLRGGYVFALLYIIVLLVPALKGIFKTNNSLTKALGIYIILSLIELYPFGWPAFNLKYWIIWMGALICSSPGARKMNDLQIKQYFF